jgi:hypothetical protein
MLNEVKHLWLFLPGIVPEMVRDGKPGLADFVRCVAASLRSE